MRAVLVSVSEADLEERRKRGLDHLDEMWEGVLHMPPAPDLGHQDIATGLGTFLRQECARRTLGKAYIQAGVHDPVRPKNNYRIPDITFVAVGNEKVLQKRGVVGAADAVIEVRSPDDETYEKFPFYARLRVRQVIVIDVETREPEVYRLAGSDYVAVAPDRQGWLVVEVLGVRLRWIAKRRLRVEAIDNPKFTIDL